MGRRSGIVGFVNALERASRQAAREQQRRHRAAVSLIAQNEREQKRTAALQVKQRKENKKGYAQQ